MTQSELEATMDLYFRVAGITGYMREFKWHEFREWRADFAFVPQRILLEVQGGEWVRGRHNRGKGYTEDCIKLCEAVIHGWHMLWVTGAMVKDGRALQVIERALARGGESYRYESGGCVTEWKDG